MYNLVLAYAIGDKWMARNSGKNDALDDSDGVERTPSPLVTVDNSSPTVDN